MSNPFSTASPIDALLLIGPTGAGKTPLGEALADRGLGSRRCLHFDFVSELRRAAEPNSDVSDADRAFIRRVIEEGSLLEPEDFPVAARLIASFLARHASDAGGIPSDCGSDTAAFRGGTQSAALPGSRCATRAPDADTKQALALPYSPSTGPGALLILNGLPRRADQARAMKDYTKVMAVVELRCAPDVVLERLRRNSGGDRTGRVDDTADLIRTKLEIYTRRTLPLIDFYRTHDVPVFPIEVGVDTCPTTTAENLESIRLPVGLR